MKAKITRFFKNQDTQYLYFAVIAIVLVAIYFLNQTSLVNSKLFGSILNTAIYFISGLGFALLLGYGGLASLGTAGFIAIGAFGFHYFYKEANLPFLLVLLAVMGVAAIFGVAFGFVSLRISGMYLAIITMGLSQIITELIKNMPAYASTTSGGFGASGIVLMGIKLKMNTAILFAAIFSFICMFIIHNLINSKTGRCMLSMKNSETAAQTMGINLLKYRLIAFVVASIFASLAGVTRMLFSRGAGTTEFGLAMALNILAAVVVGGMKSIWGILLGTFVVFGLDMAVFQNLTWLPNGTSMIINGILIIVVVMFYPGGLIQLFSDISKFIKFIIRKTKERKYGKD